MQIDPIEVGSDPGAIRKHCCSDEKRAAACRTLFTQPVLRALAPMSSNKDWKSALKVGSCTA